MSTVFTMPGKLGDALLQWPIAHHWLNDGAETDRTCEIWLDENTCKPLVPLFRAQPGVTAVNLVSGVENWNCGGQPFHMNLPTSAFDGRTIYHLGLRAFPVRQITLQTMNDCRVPVSVDTDTLANEPSIVLPDAPPPANRLLLHGQGICPHSRSTPRFWRFLAAVRDELEAIFSEICFVGSSRDLEVAHEAYPRWGLLPDDGDFLVLARNIADSRAFIGCGSAPVALAGALKVPAIRVHDPIGNDAPKMIWDNLGENQLNDTDIGLRKSWPEFRDRWLKTVDSAAPTP